MSDFFKTNNNTTCFINFFQRENLFEIIFENKKSLDLVFEFTKNMNFSNVFILTDENDKFEYPYKVIRAKNSMKSVLDAFLQAEDENIFYFDCFHPFINLSLNQKILQDHLKYKNDFTFSIGYPCGLSGQVLQKGIVKNLIYLIEEDTSVYENFLFEIIKKDINAFDIDSDIAKIDLRMLRLDFSTKTLPEFFYLKNIAKNIYNKKIDEVLEYVKENQKLLYTLPNYYMLQISSKCPFSCIYCPHKSEDEYMSFDDFKSIIEKIDSVSKNYYISLSLYGEPAFCKDVYKMIGYLQKNYNVKEIIIETTGIGWNFDFLSDLSKTKFILSKDTDDVKKYIKTRLGSDESYYNQMLDFLGYFLDNHKENIYIQTVRIDEFEDEMLNFYKTNKQKAEVIVQKFINFEGIKNLSSINISPKSNNYCFHLRREMCILPNGDVLRCFKDKTVVSNILTHSIQDALDSLKHEFVNYEDKKQICLDCDDYYIYNF